MIQNITFKNVLLQESTVDHLRKALAKNRTTQTYLFTGEGSIGKHFTAMAFAAAIQCLNPIAEGTDSLPEACGVCSSCKRIAAGTHPDVLSVSVQGNNIRIEQIRRLQESAFLQPNMGAKRIFIIDPADRLNVFSANSLLKILEEAPSHALFILIAENLEHILPTIRSRAEHLAFRTPSHNEARKILAEMQGKTLEEAAECYALTRGAFGKALLLLDEGREKYNLPTGIRKAHKMYLESLQLCGQKLCGKIENVQLLEEALLILETFCNRTNVSLEVPLREFTRSLFVGNGLPAAFPALFTRLFFDVVENIKKNVKKEIGRLITAHKCEYSQNLLKEIEESCDASIAHWTDGQAFVLIESLLYWYEDAYKLGFSDDDAQLLNLDRKGDIMAVIAFYGPAFIRERLYLLLEALESLRRFVQPALVLEHVLSEIGGQIT